MVDEREFNDFRSALLNWAKKDDIRDFSWRTTDSSYNVFIAEILLGATQAQKVDPIYKEFVSRYPDFETLSEANVDELARLLEPLGLHNRRARAFAEIADELAEDKIPHDIEELQELPYVGNYAAAATLCFGFGEPVPIVDSNVTRVYNRAFGLDLNPESETAWEFAQRILPEEKVQLYNFALLDFGAAICTSGNPNCEICFYSDDCTYYQSLQNTAGEET
jgi:A/G-specific adenine glycosylase